MAGPSSTRCCASEITKQMRLPCSSVASDDHQIAIGEAGGRPQRASRARGLVARAGSSRRRPAPVLERVWLSIVEGSSEFASGLPKTRALSPSRASRDLSARRVAVLSISFDDAPEAPELPVRRRVKLAKRFNESCPRLRAVRRVQMLRRCDHALGYMGRASGTLGAPLSRVERME